MADVDADSASAELPADEKTILEEIGIEHLLHPLVALLNLDACEVYLRRKQDGDLCLVHRYGRLENIWNDNCLSDPHSNLSKKLNRGESHIINLPNRRLASLNPRLKEKAFGQVICCPIMAEAMLSGFFCAAHTRRNLLNDNELSFLLSLGEWIGVAISSSQKNQQIRMHIISEERERIGMDLHDGIIQSLYGVGLSLQNALLLRDKNERESEGQIAAALDAINEAIRDIRAYILDLRPRQLRDQNLYHGIESLVREFRANTLIEVDLEKDLKNVENIPDLSSEILFHICQEALANVAKHARATRVNVRLWETTQRVMIKVSDDGAGFDLAKINQRLGHGLSNMTTRAEAVGGGIEIISIRHQGTTVLAWVPNAPSK